MAETSSIIDRDEAATSYVDGDGEWKTRKITLMGVVRSFVSQLKPGQDLTRVSLPAVLLHPFSMLEIFGQRELIAFDVLLPLNKEPDPLERFMCVLRWFFATIQNETFHKKPYNPILGEQHECWTESKEYGKTQFMTEQVSHHPPIAAIHVQNTQEDIKNQCNVSFGVKFGGNYVSIVTEGAATITAGKFKESYDIAKRTPDMVVKNVIFGTKRIYWSGDVTLACPKNRYSASFSFKESGNDNVVNGTISWLNDEHDEELLFNVKGKCGGEIILHSAKSNEKRLLIDIGALLKKKPHIFYPAWKDLDPFDSLQVWSEVSKNIIENDMDQADEIKKKIEAAQRERINERKASGMEHAAKHFVGTEAGWVYKNQSKSPNQKKSKKNISDLDDSDDDSESEQEIKEPLPPPVMEIKKKEHDDDTEDGEESPQDDKKAIRESSSSESAWSKIKRRGGSRSNSMVLKKDEVVAELRKESHRFSNPIERQRTTLRSPSGSAENLGGGGEMNIIKGWMKMRNSMKIWINRWFVLRPGKLIYYKDEKDMVRDRCAGILRLADCKVKERPTNKDGFSFKIYHLLHYPIYHKYGLRGETLKMAMIPVSWNYCILRVSSEQDRRTWMSNINQQIEFANVTEGSKVPGHPLMHSFEFSPSDEESFGEKKDEFEATEAAEEMFSNETFQRNLMNGLGLQQKSTIKAVQKKTIKAMDDWKSELDMKLIGMEKKLMAAINKNKPPTHQVSLTYWQLALILLLWFLVTRLF